MLVPVDEVCQHHLMNCDGVPFQESVTSPHALPDWRGVGGVEGACVSVTATEVLGPQHPDW